MDIKGIIFDLDGVIVHTDKFHYQAWKKIADKLGIYFDQELNNQLRGVSRAESFEIILKINNVSITPAEKEALIEEKNQYYRLMLESMTLADVDNKVRDTLRSLKHQGIKIAIGSSSKNAKFILERIGLISLFDAVVDGNNIISAKPSPEVFLNACFSMKLKPEQCMVVEDAEKGIEAAKAGNMYAVGINNAYNCADADGRINSFSEILDIIRKVEHQI